MERERGGVGAGRRVGRWGGERERGGGVGDAGRRVGRWGGERERWCGCREKGREMVWRERWCECGWRGVERERWCGCREKGREMGWRERGGVGAGRRVGRWGVERSLDLSWATLRFQHHLPPLDLAWKCK